MSGALGLRRELGTLESYAALVGIFKMTCQAWSLTGPSVILGHLVLARVVLATSVPYVACVSTPFGREPAASTRTCREPWAATGSPSWAPGSR